MATTNTPPRFFTVFISQFSSDSMLIPISYNDELPRRLPKTAVLQGTGGCVWNVSMKRKQEEVYFGQGWAKFVKENSLSDGDFLTFVYNGDCIFEVSIYGSDGCKETRAVPEVEVQEEEDIVWSLSEDTDISSEPVPRIKNKGKKQKEVVESSDDEVLGLLDCEENTNSDSSYDPNSEDTDTYVQPNGKNQKKKGKGKLIEDVEAIIDSYDLVDLKEKREIVKSKIKNPEAYLDDPDNVYFETSVKNRSYELLVRAQLVRDYSLKFQAYIDYIDNHKDGKLNALATTWKDQRVVIKRWDKICKRNKLKKEDGILCELFRKRGLVHAVKIHIIRAKDL